MALAQNRLIAPLWGRLRTKVGVRFTRFVGVAAASLATSEIALTLCNGVFHLTATPAAIIAWFAGAVVSYVLSRWAWERKGKPDVLRETVPFWVISAMVVVILTLATKFAYHAAAWMGLHGIKHVLFVDFVYLVANLFTFLLRFVIFHYVLFAERTTAARAAATGPDAIPPGTRNAPNPAEAPHSAALAATAEATNAETTAPAPGAAAGAAVGDVTADTADTVGATRAPAKRPRQATSAANGTAARTRAAAARSGETRTTGTRAAGEHASGTTSANGSTPAAAAKPAASRSAAKAPRGGSAPSAASPAE